MDSYAYDNEAFSHYYDEFVATHIPEDIYWIKTVKHIYTELIKRTFVDNSEILVVELGCGTGENLFYFYDYFQQSNIKFIGIDHSEAMLDRAREKLNDQTKNSIEFRHGNLTNFAKFFPKKSIDCILLPAGTYHHLITDLEREELIENIEQTLRPDTGLFAIYLMPESFIRIESIALPNDYDKFQLISSENIQQNNQEWLCQQVFQFNLPPKLDLTWQLRTCSISNFIQSFCSKRFQLIFYCLNGKDIEFFNENIISSWHNISTSMILVFRTIKNTS